MRTKVIWILAAAVAFGAAYLAGYWPERGQRLAAEGQAEAEILHDIEVELRGALDYEMPPVAGVTP